MPRSEHSDDETSSHGPEVLLGFVEEVDDATALLRHRFPSKVGGRPAWLDPVHLPSYDALSCPYSGRPLQFLLQVYAPVDDPPSAFHRTVYLFISSEGDKLGEAGTVRAFRCQLPRRNRFYCYHPAKEDDIAPQPLPEAEKAASLERDSWRVMDAEAAAASGQELPPAAHTALFPELELIVEPEDEAAASGEADPQVQRALQEYRERVEAEGELDEEELPEEVVEQVDSAVHPEQQHFAEFQAKMAAAPEQVLRYSFHADAEPLWPSTTGRPEPADIPACPRCGASRQFEFQVLPQLIASLDIDDLDPHAPDWGTIAVYSCSRSCDPGNVDGCAYAEEFCWVQPP